MKLLYSLFWLMSVSLISVSAQNKPVEPQSSPRTDKIINSNWTFNYFPSDAADKGYELPSYDDSKWIAVSIPHSWQTYETTHELHPFILNASETANPYWWNGWGWYRKHFSISQVYADRKVFIEFEGVQKYCKVWINGIYLGDHMGGYGSFDFEITRHIKRGGDNVIAVAVNNSRIDKLKIPPLTTDNLNVFGGICRDVTIAIRNNIYFPMQGSALHEGGTFISTPEVNARSGLVRIQTWVKNDNTESRNCVLQTSVYDAANKLVQQVRSTADIKPNQVYRFDQITKPVRNPHLWSPEDPYLYRVVSEVTDGKSIADSYTSSFGFRWFRWDYKENVLYLNGKKTLLQRGERQKEHPWLGDAIPNWITEMDLSEKRNYNFISTAHYPNTRLVNYLADMHGIIIGIDIKEIMDLEFSPDIRVQLLKEIIRRDRNHPSIMFWLMGAGTNKPDMKFITAEDTTRIVTDIATINAGMTEKGKTETSHASTAGEAAKIVLRSSHDKISAERGSVVIIYADVIDSGGKKADIGKKMLKWILSGPASMVGPSTLMPDNASSASITNVIRSTGDAGNIKVTVSASGLASGSLTISSEAVQSDNSVIVETVLRNEGRTGLERTLIKSSRLEDMPREIKLSYDAIKITASGKDGYKKAIRDHIVKDNPEVDSASVEFRILAELLGSYLSNNSGQLIADDYNFNVDHFNTCRLISGYINATKLPAPFKDGLRVYYSNSVIRYGFEKDAGDEMNWLNWIPSGGTVIFYDPEAKNPPVKGTLLTSKNDLSDMISLVHPGFEKFSGDAKERALAFIAKMNPYVQTDIKSEVVDGKNVITTRLLAEKGQPVLIPLYKFITE